VFKSLDTSRYHDKKITKPNTVNKVNKLVTVFAFAPAPKTNLQLGINPDRAAALKQIWNWG
jgi:hypothetical protein